THSDRKRPWESIAWLACSAGTLCCVLFTANGIWEFWTYFALHAFAVYYVTARANLLVADRSGGFLPVDIFNTVIIYPFKYFFLKVKSVWYYITLGFRRGKRSAQTLVFTLCAIAVGIALLIWAGSLLSSADDKFRSMMDIFRIEINAESLITYILRAGFSIPIGSYIAGLILGTHRESGEESGQRAQRYSRSLTKLKKVPSGAWIAVIAVICAMYAVFFGVQASYLFGAFAGRLPESFTVANYARQGFFEMCRVMGLNLLLLLLTVRTSAVDSKPVKILCTVLLGASILFAATAMSKLGMYISIFGLTPLRIQSSWLVCSLTCGCICAGIYLWSGKRTFRTWLLFSAMTFVVAAFL
ncbi:MAG: DUF4173 domain-containing protein, partial [Oscillospiraceae bacterium]|nr:DUF4173 domain-containing protein [Oscillospiraceae bacterium]